MSQDGSQQTGSQSAPRWQDLVNQHMSMLNDHLKLWVLLQSQYKTSAQISQIAAQCVEHTQDMIRNIQHLPTIMDSGDQGVPQNADSQNDVELNSGVSVPKSTGTQNQEENIPLRPSKRRRTEQLADEKSGPMRRPPVRDQSGLFSIDSNPTPIDELLAQKPADEESQPPSKRAKKQPYGYSKAAGQARAANGNEQGMTPNTGRNANNKQHIANTENEFTAPPQSNAAVDSDAFLAKVAKKHQEKEAKRKKKADKKRKRGSGTSAESLDAREPDKGESRKKKKRKQGEKTET